jgi:hypothetical protein
MIWWVTLSRRASEERLGIADLEHRNSWLENVSWRLEGELVLTADFDVVLQDGEVVPLTIQYPNFFPDVPPRVLSREGRLLSGHQYGAGGELCLEFRPDNWEPSITGAMMIESAYRLLSGEKDGSSENNGPPEVPSAHEITFGQEIRTTSCRLVLPFTAGAALSSLPALRPTPAEYRERKYAETWIAYLTKVDDGETQQWSEEPPVGGGWKYEATAIRLPPGATIPAPLNLKTLAMLFDISGLSECVAKLENMDEDSNWLIVDDTTCRLIMVYKQDKGKRQAIPYRTVPLALANPFLRLPRENAGFREKRVGIVGCGSVGSKIAVSLARSGIGNFIFVDGDILLPENLVRNELDWRAVGTHKVEALATRVREVAPKANVSTFNVNFGGQESAKTTSLVMSALGECDLIIEATASPGAFNLCAAVAKSRERPMLWAEVFAGGIGGIVARSRPHTEPPPHSARRQINGWCNQHGIPWGEIGSDAPYTALGPNQQPLVADDGAVSVIAAHLTRLAVDTLAGVTTSFPQSAYAIGLSSGWIFSAPFDTWPIDLCDEAGWVGSDDDFDEEHLKSLLSDLLPQAERDADQPST